MAERDLMSSVQLVYERTRRAIIEGKYAPGVPLRIQVLAEENGVSLIPVREAIRMLAAESLVEVIPNRGARVARLSLSDLRDLYRTRTVLEGEALRQAAPHLGPVMITRARRELDLFIAALDAQDVPGYVHHRRFHFLLYEPSQSRWLMRFIAVLWDHTERYRLFSVLMPQDDTVLAEHNAILDRLEEGDIEGAVQALTVHLENAIDVHARFQGDLLPPDGDDD